MSTHASIEERTFPVSIKLMYWSIASVFGAGLVIAAGFFNLQAQIKEDNNNKEKKDIVQDIQIQTNALKVQQIEMDMRDIQKSINLKEDKPVK